MTFVSECVIITLVPARKKKRRQFFMRSGKKSIAVLAAVLALVLAVQAFAFTAVKLRPNYDYQPV